MDNKRKKTFISWCGDYLKESEPFVDDAVAVEIIKNYGFDGTSLYSESNAFKLRKILSKVVVDPPNNVTVENEYLSAVGLLVKYILYLEYVQKNVRKKNKNDEDYKKTMDSLSVAYYLSRGDKIALSELKYKNFTQAFSDLAELLGQKVSTLKNMRDEFDPYFDNGRVGWYQRELKGTRKEVFDKYKDVTMEQLTKEIKNLIESYKSKNGNENFSSHKKIKIGSSKMKEIKSKK